MKQKYEVIHFTVRICLIFYVNHMKIYTLARGLIPRRRTMRAPMSYIHVTPLYYRFMDVFKKGMSMFLLGPSFKNNFINVNFSKRL